VAYVEDTASPFSGWCPRKPGHEVAIGAPMVAGSGGSPLRARWWRSLLEGELAAWLHTVAAAAAMGQRASRVGRSQDGERVLICGAEARRGRRPLHAAPASRRRTPAANRRGVPATGELTVQGNLWHFRPPAPQPKKETP